MALLLGWWLGHLFTAGVLIALVLYAIFSYCFTYWRKKGVPFVQPSFPFGNFKKMFVGSQTVGLTFQEMYQKLEGHSYGGFYAFHTPVFLVRDPDLIRHVLIKDFQVFHDRGIPFNESEPLNHHLLFITGNKWRQLRFKLSPAFSSGKLKNMFPTMAACGREMVAVLLETAGRGEVLEMRELAARFSTDVIASVAFGLQVNCQRDPETEFRRLGRQLFQPSMRTKMAMLLLLLLPHIAPKLKVRGPVELVSEYFRRIVYDTVRYREANNVSRNDFMQLLLQLKNKGFVEGENNEEESEKLSLDDLAAQAFVFFAAGFETSSTTMSFALHELAWNPEVQRKLQQELDDALQQGDGSLSYDHLVRIAYLDQVVAETLRKYPPVPFLNRVTLQPYQVPDSDLVLEEDQPVVVPVYGLHHDPRYYPDPDRFDPERFSEHEKDSRHPYVYLPFGEGPRMCIGNRLGLLQTKIGLAYLLSKFDVQPSELSTRTLKFDTNTGILMSKSGIQLRITRRALSSRSPASLQ